MGSFRGALSLWNETGAILSLLLCIGYFGSRRALAFLPGVLLTVFVLGGIGGCIWMAIQQSQAVDDYSESKPWGNRALCFTCIFLVSTLAVTLLGSVL